jgi:DNA-binding CsgD family transcriptional regulator
MSAVLLEGVFQRAAEASSPEDLQRALVEFTDRHECGSANIMLVVDNQVGPPSFSNVEHLPESYKAAFHDLGSAQYDPVMQFIKRSSLPKAWNADTYIEAGQKATYDHMADCGLREGVAMASHLPSGRHICLGLDRQKALPKNMRHLTRMMGEMQLFVAHVTEAAFRLIPPAHLPPQPVPDLSSRELEALRWTIDGKTAWEIGVILGIAERTVAQYLGRAMAKLDCTSKHQAAIKALRLRLIA